MKKRILIFLFVFLILFSFTVPSFAVSEGAYNSLYVAFSRSTYLNFYLYDPYLNGSIYTPSSVSYTSISSYVSGYLDRSYSRLQIDTSVDRVYYFYSSTGFESIIRGNLVVGDTVVSVYLDGFSFITLKPNPYGYYLITDSLDLIYQWEHYYGPNSNTVLPVFIDFYRNVFGNIFSFFPELFSTYRSVSVLIIGILSICFIIFIIVFMIKKFTRGKC